MNNLKKYSADLERTLITTPLVRRNKNGTVVLQESILKSRIKKLETLIEKALTPPTSEEVCEALSEYYDKEVIIDKRYNKIIFSCKRGSNITQIDDKDNVRIIQWLPPKLGKMIFDFYEVADNG